MSELMVRAMLLSLSGLLISAVEEEESEELLGALVVGEVGLGVMSVEGSTAGIASEMLGDSGPITFTSLIEHTIFSNPSDVMCFSLPREAAMVVGGLLFDCVLMLRGTVGDGIESSFVSESSEQIDLTLPESSGTSSRPGLDLEMSIAGVVVNCGCDSQQRVSRFHMRQLRFSRRLPSSIDSAHFEKTLMNVSVLTK